VSGTVPFLETNVARVVNYYQRKAGGTSFAYYLGGSSANGTAFNPIFRIDDFPIDPAFGGLKGTTLQTNLAGANVVQENVTGYGARTATRVTWTNGNILNPPVEYDAALTAANVQHDTMPWYVRGGVGPGYDSLFNTLKEIDDAWT
jgi:hypothetical protein